MGSVNRDWPARLDICMLQLQLAISAKQPLSIEEWLNQGFEAIEKCTNIINTAGLDPIDIERINVKITNFKLICKTDDKIIK
jgi:hypothetical protein